MAGPAVVRHGDRWYSVDDGSRRWRVAVAEDAGGHWVFVDGVSAYVAAVVDAGGRPRAKATTDSGVMAPMPATVLAIHIKAGQPVEQDDTLIVLEAMKMELQVRSPRAGVIKSIHCATGDLVQPGVNLLELE